MLEGCCRRSRSHGRRATGREPYVRSYVFMRLSSPAGDRGAAVLVFGEPLVFDGMPFVRGSLSAYYYSGARELFVGLIWAIAVFLLIYKIVEWSRESLLSSVAGLAAIAVAVFPTGRPGRRLSARRRCRTGSARVAVEKIHFVAAAVFIAALGLISPYFARYRTDEQRELHWAAVGAIGLAAALRARRRFHGPAGQGDPDRRVDCDLGVRRIWLATVELDRPAQLAARRQQPPQQASGRPSLSR